MRITKISLVILILLSWSCTRKENQDVPVSHESPYVTDVDGKEFGSIDLTKLGGDLTIRMDDTDPWELEVDVPWITVDATKGFFPMSINLHSDVNPFPEAREGKLTFRYLYKNPGKSTVITIRQEASSGIRKSHPRDLMLYYCGVTSFRDYYSEDIFMDYLISDEDVPRRMFDGALLLEIWKDGTKDVNFMGGNSNSRYCYLSEMMDLFDTWVDVVLPRLDNALEKSKGMSSQPFYKQEVVMMIPIVPFLHGQEGWGSIPGHDTIDWNSWDETFAVYKYIINELLKKYLAHDYRNLELVGLYWPNESVGIANSRILQMSEYIKSNNLEFYFIPYYSDAFESAIYSIWKKYGFDYCYLQPNYFFYEKVEKQRLYDACQMAKQYDMDLEMEFNPTSYSNWGVKRTDDYIDVFEEEGIWDNNNIAYYQAGKDFSVLKRSKGNADEWYRLYKRMSKHVADRWEAFHK